MSSTWNKNLVLILQLTSLAWTSLNAQDEELTSSSVGEGPCNPNIRKFAAENIDPFFVWAFSFKYFFLIGLTIGLNNKCFLKTSRPRNYYVPIASEGCYRSYAEVLLGRPARDQSELDSMKLRIRLTIPPIFYSYGYDKHFRQSCMPPIGNPSGDQVLCRPLLFGDAPETDTSGISKNNDIMCQRVHIQLIAVSLFEIF